MWLHYFQCSIPVYPKEKMSSTIAKPHETVSPQNEEIRIELIEEKDSAAVLNMLKEFFFKVLHFKSNLIGPI